MTMSNPAAAPTPSQVLEARFEAVKVVLAVAERVLLNEYERQIIIQAAILSAQGLQAEYKRLNEPVVDPAVKVEIDEDGAGEGPK